MLIIFLVIGILLCALGFMLRKKINQANNSKAYVCQFIEVPCLSFGANILLFDIIAICFLLTVNANNNKKQNQVDMLIEENNNIQQIVDTAVKNYCEHENKVYTEIIGDNVMYVAAIYPSLESNELVKKQVELYTENSAEIKQLKTELIYSGTIRFWLYLGN